MYSKKRLDSFSIQQGDILKDVRFITVDSVTEELFEVLYPYCIVVSQDCDLEQYQKTLAENGQKTTINNQFLPNLIVLPAFPAEHLREGIHLKELHQIAQQRINSAQYNKIKQNDDNRYQFLKPMLDLQVPELIVDFKLHFTLTFTTVKSKFPEWYLASINPLFREHLSQRFTNYINRIGLPELEAVATNGKAEPVVDNLSTTEKFEKP